MDSADRTSTTDPAEARALLDAVQDHQTQAQRDSRDLSVPLLVLGGLLVVEGILRAFVDSSLVAGFYWIVAAPAGLAATAWYYRRREQSAGLGRNAGVYGAVAIGLVLLVLLAGPIYWLVGALPVVAVALGAVAVIRRNRRLGVVAAALFVFGLLADTTSFLVNRLYALADAMGWFPESSGYFSWASGLIDILAGLVLVAAGAIAARRERRAVRTPSVDLG